MGRSNDKCVLGLVQMSCTSDPAANMADHAEGWVEELDKLVALLEGDA